MHNATSVRDFVNAPLGMVTMLWKGLMCEQTGLREFFGSAQLDRAYEKTRILANGGP